MARVMYDASMHFLDAHEVLDDELSAARIALAHDASRARSLAFDALRHAGLTVSGDGPAEQSPASWLLVIHATMEDGTSVFALPDATLDGAARAALQKCHGKIVETGTDTEDPTLFAAWMHVAVATATCTLEDFEMELGDLGAVPVSRETLESIADAWGAAYAGGGIGKNVDGAKLGPLAGVTYVLQRL